MSTDRLPPPELEIFAAVHAAFEELGHPGPHGKGCACRPGDQGAEIEQFLRLGLQAFGGGIGKIDRMDREAVVFTLAGASRFIASDLHPVMRQTEQVALEAVTRQLYPTLTPNQVTHLANATRLSVARAAAAQCAMNILHSLARKPQFEPEDRRTDPQEIGDASYLAGSSTLIILSFAELCAFQSWKRMTRDERHGIRGLYAAHGDALAEA